MAAECRYSCKILFLPVVSFLICVSFGRFYIFHKLLPCFFYFLALVLYKNFACGKNGSNICVCVCASHFCVQAALLVGALNFTWDMVHHSISFDVCDHCVPEWSASFSRRRRGCQLQGCFFQDFVSHKVYAARCLVAFEQGCIMKTCKKIKVIKTAAVCKRLRVLSVRCVL